ncbi:acetolactate synthase, large subunit, biosynthetic type [Streptomyces spiroverticillatus]|uniref:Acetolactate synthase, large subunit, biosynthetic type n=1 Tax=Streptomyces finlayi TaxID=67296 RepID=A0A919CDS3_9ACTN|nr:thiamine pyrophosphate-binding protein [Streptomyces finlayi]GHA36144.1 acetolactate synthase, large subunit, biosynthetic type [Streptomyces spiroverticillatus]GHD12414.1 acetolactate synthase, large subunit, biosynthetic type [Streptomyces finlayi]
MSRPAPRPTCWSAIADHLEHLGTRTVFCLPGDDMALLAALEDRDIEVVLCRDQRNAVFMATGYALASGTPGVCAIGKGPAFTNALTGLLEAQAAAAPVILVADGTPLGRLGTGAFQEFDQMGAVRPFTKWAKRIDSADQLAAALDKATAVCLNGTPGPVYLELAEQLPYEPPAHPVPRRRATPQRLAPDSDMLREAASVIASARRPLILAGGGSRHRNAGRCIERLAEVIGAGMFTTASGRGSLDENHPLFCGLAGLYSTGPAAALWADTDLVIALGSRLEETAVFGWPESHEVPVIQVTADELTLVTGRPGCGVIGDVSRVVSGWASILAFGNPDPVWTDQVRETRNELLALAEERSAAAAAAPLSAPPKVSQVLDSLRAVVPDDTVLVQENGLNDMWSYHFPHWSCGARGGSVVPSEQTPLGFGAAAALGVAHADPARPVAAVVGDGAFHLFRAELPTLADSKCPVLYVVLDNGGYGWLQTNLDQVSGGESRFSFIADRASGLDALSQSLGLGHWRVDSWGDLEGIVRKAWEQCSSGVSTVVEVAVSLADAPPGVEVPAGDFPDREAPTREQD